MVIEGENARVSSAISSEGCTNLLVVCCTGTSVGYPSKPDIVVVSFVVAMLVGIPDDAMPLVSQQRIQQHFDPGYVTL